MALAASILIMAFSLYLLLYRSSEIPKTPGELLEKTEALKEMPFQAKAKINTEVDAGKVCPTRSTSAPAGKNTTGGDENL